MTYVNAFQGFCAEVTTVDEVKAVMAALKENMYLIQCIIFLTLQHV